MSSMAPMEEPRQQAEEKPKPKDYSLPFRISEIPDSLAELLKFKGGYDFDRRNAFASRVNYLLSAPDLPDQFAEVASLLVRAYNDFTTYDYLDAVPVLRLNDEQLPVSGSTMLSAAKRADPSVNFQDAVGLWPTLDSAHEVVNSNDGLSFLREGFSRFLAGAVDGIEYWRENHKSGGPGFDTTADLRGVAPPSDVDKGLFSVTVTSKNKGYRILVSPAYFIDWVYFGEPSTPVSSYLNPGRYIFGTDSIDGKVIFDGAIFRIPTSFNPHVVKF